MPCSPLLCCLSAACCGAIVLAAPLAAQPRGGPAERLRQLDQDGDGRLSDEEIPERVRPFLMRAAQNAGLDRSQPLSIDALAAAVSGRPAAQDEGAAAAASAGDAPKSNGDDERLVPGFGVDAELPAVPGFGAEDESGSGATKNRGLTLEDRYGSAVIRYVEGILQRYDRDKSGVLEKNEWEGGRWRTPPETSDTDNDGRLTREELCERVKDYDWIRGSSSGDRSSRYGRGSDRGSSSDRGSGGSSGSKESRERFSNYAKGLISRYDENKNGVLEENEWKRMSSFHRGADADGDKRITRDELTDRLASYSQGKGSSSGGGSSPSRPAADKPGDSYKVTGPRLSGGRRSYKAQTPAERLPKGLPDWFTRNDANGDGQISLAEFAVTITDDKLQEFHSLDANQDGLIIPRECLGEGKSSSSGRSSESRPSSRYRRR